MGRRQGIAEPTGRLRRVVALLLALAVLAERAGRRGPAVRFWVFWLLRRAETLTRGYVEAMAPQPWPGAMGTPETFDAALARTTDTAAARPPETIDAPGGAAEALRLAASFRALAALIAAVLGTVLEAVSAPGRRPERLAGCAGLAARAAAALGLCRTRVPARARLDSS